MQYEFTLPAEYAILFKTGTYTYDVYYPKQFTVGATRYACKEIAKRTVNFSYDPPTWSNEKTINVAEASKLENPIIPLKNMLGYDFYKDRILFVLGEWDKTSWLFNTKTAKLMTVDRNLSAVEVLHDDLLSLAKEAASDATHFLGYAHFWGHGGKVVGTLATYSEAEERSVIAVYDGTSWSSKRANQRYDTVQTGLTPIWFNENLIGWLTEGHGGNNYFIRITDLKIILCIPPLNTTTPEPAYDPLNRKVIWTEWGAGYAVTQRMYIADPHPENGCVNFQHVTPYGEIKDKENNKIDLAVVNKHRATVFVDNVNKWLVMSGTRGGLPEREHRILRVDIGKYSDPARWAVITDPSENDKLISGKEMCLSHDGKPLPTPMIIAIP